MTRLRVASYNVHGCVGIDDRYEPERIAEVIAALDADVVAVQEMDAAQGALLGRLADYRCLLGPPVAHDRPHFGNALLSRLPVGAERQLDLSLDGREPRGALDVDVECAGRSVRILATHFGLTLRERMTPVRRLLSWLSTHDDGRPLLVAGDFNDWMPGSPTLVALRARLGRSFGRASFPSWKPMFALDRIYARPRGIVRARGVFMSRTAQFASDHLPVWAELDMGLLPGPPAPHAAARSVV